MTYYPGPNGIELIKAFEGAPRLVAELCEGGAVEAGYGSTYHLDGRKFKEGERITPGNTPTSSLPMRWQPKQGRSGRRCGLFRTRTRSMR